MIVRCVVALHYDGVSKYIMQVGVFGYVGKFVGPLSDLYSLTNACVQPLRVVYLPRIPVKSPCWGLLRAIHLDQ